jgi:hypothetical protein
MLLFIFAKCAETGSEQKGNPKEETIKQILALEKKVLKNEKISPDTALALVRMQEEFAKTHAQDSLAPVFLFRGGDIARGAGEPGLAIKLWGAVQRKYPEFPRAPEALFLQAFVFETEIQDINNARLYYENFINRYPGHEYAQVAKMALENLGKRPEDLIREFEKNTPEDR